MQDVVPAVAHVETAVLLQLTEFPFLALVVPLVNDVGVVPKREMINPWQYPPGDGLVPGLLDVPTAGIDP